MKYTIHAAKTQFSKLVAQAEEGKEVLIGRGNGKPTVQLVRIQNSGTRLRRHPELKGSIVKMNRKALTQPLPSEEWGNLIK